MGRRGPKAKPTALKILEGDQPCRINFDEPASIAPSLVCPEWLSGHAIDEWNRLAPLLARIRVFSEADRSALAVLCDDYRRLRDDPDDWKARDRYRRMLVEFGLTPSSRSRLKAPPEKPRDELESFLEGKTG